MDSRYFIEFSWQDDTNRWTITLHDGDILHPLGRLEELSRLVGTPFLGEIAGRAVVHSGGDTVEADVTVTQKAVKGRWLWEANATGKPDFKTALAAMVRMGGGIFPAEILPAAVSKSLTAQYKSASLGSYLLDDVTIKLISDAKWNIVSNLSIGELGLLVSTDGVYGEFSLVGSLFLGKSHVELLIAYRNDALVITTDTREEMPLPTLDDFAGLFGLSLGGMLPEQVASLGNPQLRGLYVRVPTSRAGIDQLEFTINFADTWRIFGLDSLTLSKLRLFVHIDTRTILSISGQIAFCGETLMLEASKYGDGSKWRFSGVLYNGREWGLASLWELVSVGDIPDVVRDMLVPIKRINVSYDLGAQQFDISAVFKNGNRVFLDSKHGAGGISYHAGITLATTIRLSSLPLVGESLHLFDSISLDGLALDYKTALGMCLSGTFSAWDTHIPFSFTIIKPRTTAIDGTYGDANNGSAPSLCWVNTGIHAGMLELPRIGVGYGGGRLAFGIDAALNCAGLTLRCMGLQASFAMSDFTDISFGLSGLSLSLITPSLSIGGTFTKVSDKPAEYDGGIIVKAGGFSLSAIGSYTQADGKPSIFAYGVLRKALGGPPAFYITGVAAGFGYQRTLILPSLEGVATFPLVRMVFDSGNEAEYIRALKEDCCRVAPEELWFAAGIRFTSFGMVDAFALLTVSIGSKTTVALLGIGTIQLKSIVKAELALKLVFCPDDGILALTARLTPNSYVLSGDCHLTGGFAFCVWYKGEHSGDFVLSLGGYHEDFKKPAHYPDVERLGFSWRIDSHLSLSGGMYFAVTPSCIMAGGGLDARYENGNLKAWFYARADMLMYWRPFYYQIGIAAGIGVSYRVDFLFVHHTFSFELSASLDIRGPEFSGKMHIKLWIISFTISFGSSNSELRYIDWNTFLAECVKPQSNTNAQSFATAAVSDGLIDTAAGVAQVRGEELGITVHTMMPCTAIEVNAKRCVEATAVAHNPPAVHVLPMGAKPYNAIGAVTIERASAGVWQTVNPDDFAVTLQYENLPTALWGDRLSADGGMIHGALTGITITPAPIKPYIFPDVPLDLDRLAEAEAIRKRWDYYHPRYTTVKLPKAPDNNRAFAEHAASEATTQARMELFEWLNGMDMRLEGTDLGRVTVLAREADSLFSEQIAFTDDTDK